MLLVEPLSFVFSFRSFTTILRKQHARLAHPKSVDPKTFVKDHRKMMSDCYFHFTLGETIKSSKSLKLHSQKKNQKFKIYGNPCLILFWEI